MAGKTLEEHFREHGQLIDQLFAHRFGEMDKTLEPIRSDLASLKTDVSSVKNDLAVLKDAVKVILTRLT